jgi:acylphosphatase
MGREGRRVQVSGRVQGVAFRYHALEEARRLGVAGWVRNLPDGRVEAWVEGDPAAVDDMLAWLRRGPPHARVDRLEVEEAHPRGLDAFEVVRGPA